jgi:hypothetical protein
MKTGPFWAPDLRRQLDTPPLALFLGAFSVLSSMRTIANNVVNPMPLKNDIPSGDALNTTDLCQSCHCLGAFMIKIQEAMLAKISGKSQDPGILLRSRTTQMGEVLG